MIKNLLAKALLVMGIFATSYSNAQSTFTINVGSGGNLYVPANVTCTVGDTIKFVWISGNHPTQSLNGTTIPLVTMDGSGGVNSVYKVKMLAAGTVPYECTVHAGMTGIITVNAPYVPTKYVSFSGTGALNTNNWTTHSGTAGQAQLLATASDVGNSLSYAGFPTSTGNRTQIVAGNSEDLNIVVPIIPASAGSAYFSTLIKLPNTTGQAANTTVGNYFMHFNDSSGATGISALAARLSIRLGSVANTFNLGIVNTSGGTASTAAQIFGATPVDYAINQTYLVVVKYTFATNTASLWVNPAITSTEPTPLVSNNIGTSTALSKVKSICIREAGNATAGTGNIEIDELRVTDNWNDALGVVAVTNPELNFVAPYSVTKAEGDSHVFSVAITNPNAVATNFTVFVKSSSTASSTDYSGINANGITITFPGGTTGNQSEGISIVDDTTPEQAETIVLVLRNPTNGATIGSDSIMTITIPMNDQVVVSAPLLVENFSYILNDTLTKTPATAWGVVSAAANRIPVSAGLSYPNSAASGIGNAAFLKTSGEDIGKAIPGNQIRTGDIYASFLINVNSAQTAGDYFFAMLDSALQGTNFRARTFIKSSGTGFRIGVTKASAVAAAAFNTTDLTFGTTYQIVLKYVIIPGAANDSVKLFVNPVLGAPEPTATASAVTTENDITISGTVGIGGVALRQGSAANAASLTVDGIMVGQSWASVTPSVMMGPSVSFNPTTLTVAEDAGTATVTVNLANADANPTSVTVLVKGGTANGIGDYTFTSHTVTFPANSTTPQSFTFPIIDDAAMEIDETIVLVLRNSTNSATISSDSILTITIPANDFSGAVVHFAPTSLTVNENAGTAQMNVMVMGAGTTNPTSFDVVVKGGTATGSDYTYTNTTITIPAAKDSTFNITIPIIDNNIVSADKTAIFAIRNITNSGIISTDSVFTLTIKNNDIAFKNISALRTNDVNGVSVLTDSMVYIKGIVYGVDMQGSPTSMQYTLIDPTGGVGIFRAGTNVAPIITLTPEEGDSVKVYGKVGEFNGLTQVNMDSIILISKGNALKMPKVITKLDETSESNLVRFNNAQIIDTITNTASGTTLRIVSGLDSMDLRIDADVSLFGQPFPSTRFDVIGLGGQFDNSNPKNSGYQLLPRSINDVIAILSPKASLDSASYSVSEGAGTKVVKIKLTSPAIEACTFKVTLSGGTATFTQDYQFTNPTTVTIPVGQTEGNITFTIIDDNQTELNETINFGLSDATNCELIAPFLGTITIIDNDPQGININKNIALSLFPNPAKETFNVVSSELIENISVVNMIGQTVVNINKVNATEKAIDVANLNTGVYNVIITTSKGSASKRLVVE